jgi:hypothetical protein
MRIVLNNKSISIYYSIILNKVFKRLLPQNNKMGWLFGRKKVVPKVPFPEGRPFDEKSLQFPSLSSSEKVINPAQVQAAVGVSAQKDMPEEDQESMEQKQEMPETQSFTPPRQLPSEQGVGNSFVKVELYRNILSKIEDMNKSIHSLKEASKQLDISEYNEETDFIKMRRATKSVHDQLLKIDKTIFKGE